MAVVRERQVHARFARATALAERRRVARDLHDGIAQDLAFIAAHGPRFAEELGDEHPVVIAAKRALALSRSAISDLSDPAGATAHESLDAIAQELQDRFGIAIAVDASLDQDLESGERENVTRIAREAIANAARHGKAQNVIVSLRHNEQGVVLRVLDDGCGIGAGKSAGSRGLRPAQHAGACGRARRPNERPPASTRRYGARGRSPLTERLRLLIADRAPTRVGIRMALEGEVDIVAEADDSEQAIRAAMREQPDLCLVGDHISGDGLAAVRGICRAAPHSAVVVLAQANDADYLLECVRAGAVGYVPGALDADRLVRVVKAAANNEAVVPRTMVLELLLELRGGGGGADALTARESQVLGMLRRGHKTAEIAERLSIAPVTVRRHISELVRKLGVEDRAALTGAATPARPNGRVQKT